MPKTFYTERDIEDLSKRGVISLIIDDDVVLTDVARDKAMHLGMELVRERPPSAPVRPYITQITSPSATQPVANQSTSSPSIGGSQVGSKTKSEDDIYQKVYDAVVARLGSSVDEKLIETIIRRVLQTVTQK
jgi:hypothetical protein